MAGPAAAVTVGFGAGVAGGLIGLGGAELRLPYLSGLGYPAATIIAVNLAVSATTIAAALPFRLAVAESADLWAHADAALVVAAGSAAAAWVGAGLLRRIPAAVLARAMALLLLLLGAGLLVEVALGMDSAGFLPDDGPVRAAFGILSGLLIGAVSSLLGVAGGEIIIPVLVFAFGVPLKVAGTLSLLISVPTVAVGILRHRAAGRYGDRRLLRDLVAPLAVGAIVGAVVGAALSARVPADPLKVGLAALLVWSAWKVGRDLGPAVSR